MKRILTRLLFALPLAVAATALGAAAQRPNVVFILSDDMGYGDIGVHGCKDIPTPNIDRIAAGGVLFSDAYANGSFCTPTRAALMSGRYQHRHGNEDLANVTGPLPAAVRTLPDRLRAAGYTTGMVGKWHLGDQPGFTPLDRGFGEFFGFLGGGHQYIIPPDGKGEYNAPILRNRAPVDERRYLTDAFGEEAAAFVKRQHQAANPFFLYLAFNAVHTPLQATEKYLQRFAHIADLRRRTYAAMLSAMDDAIGRVLTALEQTGKFGDTLVIFHNDNGGAVNNGSRNTPWRGFKIDTWEGGIRVPLAMQWPGMLPPGAVYRQPVITMDLTATVLAAATAEAAGVEGINLLPFVRGEKFGAPHDALFWRCRTETADNCYAVRRGDWIFVHTHRYSEDGTGRGPAIAPERLYNLAVDPGERHDLAAAEPAKLAELKQLFAVWSAAVDADCRQIGIEPKTPAATSAKQAKTKKNPGR
jgi:arylsulfatase A-like enzyme